MTATATTDAIAKTLTLTVTDLPDAPSTGDVVLSVYRRRPGKPDQLLLLDQPTTPITLPISKDGVYVLAVVAGDAGTEEEPISPPEPLEQTTVTVLVDFALIQAGSDHYARHARAQSQATGDAGFPLDDYAAIYSRRYEAGALLLEGAVDAAQRLLTQPIPPAR